MMMLMISCISIALYVLCQNSESGEDIEEKRRMALMPIIYWEHIPLTWPWELETPGWTSCHGEENV
jgi:hypothetical protein